MKALQITVTMSISIMTMGYLSYHKANAMISSKVSQVALQTVQQANRRLELVMNEYDNRSLLVFANKEIQKGILGEYQESYDQSYDNQQIAKFLSNLVNVKNDTLIIHILGNGDASYRFSSNGFAELPRISKDDHAQEWYKQITAADGRVVWYGIRPNLVSDSREIGYFTVYLVIGFSVVAIAIALLVAKQMHKPVRILLKSMRRAREGDFDVQITDRRSDEFGMLFHSFNTMVTRIKNLIDEVYIQKLLKKETQLKMMASQINAHFLYNTLDSIHWISRIYKVDEISTMIFGLSKYLRISLSEGNDFALRSWSGVRSKDVALFFTFTAKKKREKKSILRL